MKPRHEYLFPWALSSFTIMVAVFLIWELIEKNFFAEIDVSSMHFLYISRGIALGGILSAWSAWFIIKFRRKYEQEEGRLQRQLFQAEKLAALGELVSGVAHEINNPIGVMISRIELMRHDAGAQSLPEGFLKDLDVLHRHACRVGSIAQNLLSFSRKSGAGRSRVDLNRVVRETLPLIEPDLKSKGISLELNLAEGLPVIQGNFNQLQQVLLNLLNNARDALLDGGRIFPGAKIRVGTWDSPQEERVRLCIVDNGPGIAQEHLNRVFDPFYTTKKMGTGLGLSVSYGIVKEHGGALTVGNDGARKACGTCFMLALPVGPG